MKEKKRKERASGGPRLWGSFLWRSLLVSQSGNLTVGQGLATPCDKKETRRLNDCNLICTSGKALVEDNCILLFFRRGLKIEALPFIFTSDEPVVVEDLFFISFGLLARLDRDVQPTEPYVCK